MLVNECIKNKINVVPIPGASSITSAMSVFGFSDQFFFYGFLPKTENELNKVLKNLSKNPFSIVFFIPAKKINFYIKSLKNYFSDRKVLIAREITKIHESFIREEIKNLKNLQKLKLKGNSFTKEDIQKLKLLLPKGCKIKS